MLLWMATTASMCSSSSDVALPLRVSALKNICGDGYTHRVEPSACGMVDSTRAVGRSRVCPGAGIWLAAGIMFLGSSEPRSAGAQAALFTGQPPCVAAAGAAPEPRMLGIRTGQPPEAAAAGPSGGFVLALKPWPIAQKSMPGRRAARTASAAAIFARVHVFRHLVRRLFRMPSGIRCVPAVQEI
jgi:hypothetical protein